jgi:hypothetical protein
MRLIDIIKENIPLEWDSDSISANPNITIQDILDNPTFKWNYRAVNFKATISDILKPIPKGPNKKPLWKWEWKLLSYRLHIDDILAHKELNWNWENVSYNKSVTFDHVLAHDDIPWNWRSLCQFCPFHIEIFRLNPYKPWNFKCLSWNKALHFNNILANLDINWDWSAICTNETITIDHVLKHHTLPWNWDRLSTNIPVRDIFKYPGLPWNWMFVAHNSKITFDDFIRNSHEKLVITSSNSFFTNLQIDNIKYLVENNILDNMPIINEYSPFLSKSEVFKSISHFANITMNDVLENIDIPWNKHFLIINSNISPKDIIKHNKYFDSTISDLFNHPKLDIDDIEALKEILSESEFKEELADFRFLSENITIADMIRTKHLPWNWGEIPNDIKVYRDEVK